MDLGLIVLVFEDEDFLGVGVIVEVRDSIFFSSRDIDSPIVRFEGAVPFVGYFLIDGLEIFFVGFFNSVGFNRDGLTILLPETYLFPIFLDPGRKRALEASDPLLTLFTTGSMPSFFVDSDIFLTCFNSLFFNECLEICRACI